MSGRASRVTLARVIFGGALCWASWLASACGSADNSPADPSDGAGTSGAGAAGSAAAGAAGKANAGSGGKKGSGEAGSAGTPASGGTADRGGGAGAGAAGSGGGKGCVKDDDCGSDGSLLCKYKIADGCAAKGTCMAVGLSCASAKYCDCQGKEVLVPCDETYASVPVSGPESSATGCSAR